MSQFEFGRLQCGNNGDNNKIPNNTPYYNNQNDTTRTRLPQIKLQPGHSDHTTKQNKDGVTKPSGLSMPSLDTSLKLKPHSKILHSYIYANSHTFIQKWV